MNRRNFLAGILAASAAPAIVRAASLMPVKVMDSGVLVPQWMGADYSTVPDITAVVRAFRMEIEGAYFTGGNLRYRLDESEGWHTWSRDDQALRIVKVAP